MAGGRFRRRGTCRRAATACRSPEAAPCRKPEAAPCRRPQAEGGATCSSRKEEDGDGLQEALGGGGDGRLFAGVRFALVGFDPVSESQVRRGGPTSVAKFRRWWAQLLTGAG